MQQTRGLSRSFNHALKRVFNGAATTVIGRAEDEPLYRHYERLLPGGTKPNPAKRHGVAGGRRTRLACVRFTF